MSLTVTIVADPTAIIEGESSTLTITAANASSVVLSDNLDTTYTLSATGGTQVVTPPQTTTYTATATGSTMNRVTTFSDDFHRADATDLGSNWSSFGYDGSITQDWNILNNQAFSNTTSAWWGEGARCWNNFDAFTDYEPQGEALDYWWQATYAGYSGTGNYCFHLENDSSTPSLIVRFVNGKWVAITQPAPTYTPVYIAGPCTVSVGDVFTIEAHGDVNTNTFIFTIYQNSTVLGTVTSTAGYGGMAKCGFGSGYGGVLYPTYIPASTGYDGVGTKFSQFAAGGFVTDVATSTAVVTVSLPVVPPTVTIEGSLTTVVKGGVVTLTGIATNATSVVISNNIDSTTYTLSVTGGEQTITPTQTTIYTITATGDGGVATSTCTVVVTPAVVPVVSPIFLPSFALIASYSPDGDVAVLSATLNSIPNIVEANASFILLWTTSNIASIRIIGTYGAIRTVIHPPSNVTVLGTSPPWRTSSTLNTAYSVSGLNTGTDPTSVAVKAGDKISLQYVSGLASQAAPIGTIYGAGQGNSWGSWDAIGNVPTGAVNGIGGMASQFIPAPPNAYVSGLIGSFADATGALVAPPFVTGNSGDFIVPIGATQLLMGLNDGSTWSDNSGAWIIKITISRVESTLVIIDTGLIATTGSGIYPIPNGIPETVVFTMTCYDTNGNMLMETSTTVAVDGFGVLFGNFAEATGG